MENKVISEYNKTITVDGKELKANLKSYDLPIRKSSGVECYSRIEIFDGEDYWGSMNFQFPIADEEEAESIFNSVIKQPKLYNV